MITAFHGWLSSPACAQDASLLETRFSVDIKPTPLVDALDLFTEQTGIDFLYSPSALPVHQLVHVSAQNKPLQAILEHLFLPLPIDYQEISGKVALRLTPNTNTGAYTQVVRGRVVDHDLQIPLAGATIKVTSVTPTQGAITTEDGYFIIAGLPVGRHTVVVQHLGYAPQRVGELLLYAGKELVLDIELESAPVSMDMVIIADTPPAGLPLNETAVVSARSFSVEQTQRFAASIQDPARMVQAFAGVSRSEDDLLNEVIVRGQSPKYTAWRLEGIEIPNPNHFGDDGHSSGGISMLSANMLTYSDFLTGAFPAEYGNALGGVFDLNLRKGNTTRPEYTIGVGALGLEGAFEGPFNDTYDGSYLINYRYATLGLLSNFDIVVQDAIIYQDLAFKFHLPTRRAGTFSLFGLGGTSRTEASAGQLIDSQGYPTIPVLETEDEGKGVIGLSHSKVLSSNTWMRSVVALFAKEDIEGIYLQPSDTRPDLYYVDEERSTEYGLRGNVSATHRLNAHHLVEAGLSGSITDADYLFQTRQFGSTEDWEHEVDADARILTARAYTQWTYKPSSKLDLHLGIHSSFFSLNRETSFEPRMGLSWEIGGGQTLSAGTGLHSQIEPYGVYLLEKRDATTVLRNNKSLRLSKSWHNVVGYEKRFSDQLWMKGEAYYNRGFDIPVADDPNSPFSVINTYLLYSVYDQSNGLVSAGKTTNYGIDVTVERHHDAGYYFLFTGSLFNARYTALNGNTYSSRYGTRYMLNLLGGIERKVGKNDNSLLNVNGRLVLGGGNRYTPLVPNEIYEDTETAFDAKTFLSGQLSPYFRLDTSVNFTINRPARTHTLYLDIQNIIHRKNDGFLGYNQKLQQLEIVKQLGVLPILGYRLNF